ncbi:hypothetical protein Dsin_025696 [Dipteronia sinensis]|uniref:Uncharacterized protein n=1 Tax=Dipteronia sinensis TaxID=43782 RepID=A0AAE0DXD1_9ROSI|nr:hypothetical protein Dsin_025696 [Dipteronia sinensis]
MKRQAVPSSSSPFDLSIDASDIYHGPPVFLGAVRDGEKFDFCMCNPPFFETMEETKLSPKTSCGGTPKEMVCPRGEKAFISRIIEDSFTLKQTFWYYSYLRSLSYRSFTIIVFLIFSIENEPSCFMISRWYTSMVGAIICQLSAAIDVLHSIESIFHSTGAYCKLNSTSFTVDITASKDQCNVILENEVNEVDEVASGKHLQETSSSSSCFHVPLNSLSFRVSKHKLTQKTKHKYTTSLEYPTRSSSPHNEVIPLTIKDRHQWSEPSWPE